MLTKLAAAGAAIATAFAVIAGIAIWAVNQEAKTWCKTSCGIYQECTSTVTDQQICHVSKQAAAVWSELHPEAPAADHRGVRVRWQAPTHPEGKRAFKDEWGRWVAAIHSGLYVRAAIRPGELPCQTALGHEFHHIELGRHIQADEDPSHDLPDWKVVDGRGCR